MKSCCDVCLTILADLYITIATLSNKASTLEMDACKDARKPYDKVDAGRHLLTESMVDDFISNNTDMPEHKNRIQV